MRILLVMFLVAAAAVLLPGCEAIGAIFKGGVWVGVIGVIVIIALLGLVVSVFRR
jgi:hypothetical protein